jgi:hypothetical protein
MTNLAVMNWKAALREIEATLKAYKARAAPLRKSIKQAEGK